MQTEERVFFHDGVGQAYMQQIPVAAPAFFLKIIYAANSPKRLAHSKMSGKAEAHRCRF